MSTVIISILLADIVLTKLNICMKKKLLAALLKSIACCEFIYLKIIIVILIKI